MEKNQAKGVKMYCWIDVCGRKYRHMGNRDEEAEKSIKGAGVEQTYFIDDEDGNSVDVNEFLQDFVVGSMSRIGERLITEGKGVSEKEITDIIKNDLEGFKKTVKDPVLHAKALLLNQFLSVVYDNDDNFIEDIDSFEEVEAEIYKGINNILKVKENGN